MGIQSNKSSDQEIDLVYYLALGKSTAKKFARWIKSYLLLLWTNAVVFLAIFVLISGASYSLRYIMKPAYKTEGMFISHYLPAHYYQIMIHDLDQLLVEGNSEVVAQQLGIPAGVANEIRHMEVEPLRDTILERSDTVFAPFRMSILLERIDHLEQIQGGILNYLQGQGAMATYPGDRVPGASAQQIQIMRPFLKRANPNYPNFRKYFICGVIAGVVLAMLLTPIIRRRESKTRAGKQALQEL